MPDISELHTLPQMAEALATPNFNTEQMLNQLKGFVKNDLLHTDYSVGTAKTAPRLYTRASVAIAAVLHELTLLGVADLREDNAEIATAGDREIILKYPDGALRSASIAMHCWQIEESEYAKAKNWTREDWLEYDKVKPKKGPMDTATSFYLANQNMREALHWDFQLHCFARTEFNWQRVFRGYVSSHKDPVVLPDAKSGLIPRSAILISLNPLFDRIFRDRKKDN